MLSQIPWEVLSVLGILFSLCSAAILCGAGTYLMMADLDEIEAREAKELDR